MRKKYGFTLIELLAVIIILAIIALIATPLVLHNVEDTRKSGARTSGNEYIKSFQTTIVDIMENDIDEAAGLYTVGSDGNVEIRGTSYDIPMKGLKPTEGKICVSENGDVTQAYLKVNRYVLFFDGSKTELTDLKEIGDVNCEVLDENNILIIDSASSTTRTITLSYRISEVASGIQKISCIYGTDKNYRSTQLCSNEQCVLDGLKNDTLYYYKIQVTSNDGTITEKTGKIATKDFGPIAMTAKPVNWSTSKEVAISGSTPGAVLEYRVQTYNYGAGKYDMTSWSDNSGKITLNTMATRFNPTTVYARFNDGINTKEQTLLVTSIDTTAPTEASLTFAASTNKITIVASGTDNESGIYGYQFSKDNGKTWTSIQKDSTYTFTGLAKGSYPIKIRAYNGTYATGGRLYKESATITVATTDMESGIIIDAPSACSKTKAVTIRASDIPNGSHLEYQLGTTSGNWTRIRNEATITLHDNTTVYARLWDGVNASETSTYTITTIDTEPPTKAAPSAISSANSIVVTSLQTDNCELDEDTLEYGISIQPLESGSIDTGSADSFRWQKSNHFLANPDMTYYVKTRVNDIAGNGLTESMITTIKTEKQKVLSVIPYIKNTMPCGNGYCKGTTITFAVDGDPTYFYIKSPLVFNSDAANPDATCGTGNSPGACTSVSETYNFRANIWYRFKANPNQIFYSGLSTSQNNTVYIQATDGINTKLLTVTLTKMDNEAPDVQFGTVSTTANSITANVFAEQFYSGLGEATCKYSTTKGSYTQSGSATTNSCLLYDLHPNTTYYYKYCIKNYIGSKETCKEGSATTKQSLAEPTITVTPNGWAKEKTARITFQKAADGTVTNYFRVKRQNAVMVNGTFASCGTGNVPGNCGKEESVTYLSVGTWYATSSKTVDVTFRGNGDVYALSKTSDEDEKSATTTITQIDINAPNVPRIVSSTVTTGTWTNKDVKLTLDANDIHSGVTESGISQIQYSYDQKTWYNDWTSNSGTSSKTVTKTWSSEMNRTIYFRAIDNVGRTSDSAQFIMRIDKTKPIVSKITGNVTSGTWTNRPVTLDITSTDTGSGISQIEYSNDQNTWHSGDLSTISDGINSRTVRGTWTNDRSGWVYFRAKDKAGNTSIVETYTVNIDTVPPKLIAKGIGKVTFNNDGSVLNNGVTCSSGSSTCEMDLILPREEGKYTIHGFDYSCDDRSGTCNVEQSTVMYDKNGNEVTMCDISYAPCNDYYTLTPVDEAGNRGESIQFIIHTRYENG